MRQSECMRPQKNFKASDIIALRTTSNYPITIVVFGVGDGPFDYFEGLDDMNTHEKWVLIRNRKNDLSKDKGKLRFDNLQFVDLNKEILKGKEMDEEKEQMAFFRGFMEIPSQYKKIKQLYQYVTHHRRTPFHSNDIIENSRTNGLPEQFNCDVSNQVYHEPQHVQLAQPNQPTQPVYPVYPVQVQPSTIPPPYGYHVPQPTAPTAPTTPTQDLTYPPTMDKILYKIVLYKHHNG